MAATVAAAERQLAEALRDVAQRHPEEAELFHVANRLADLSARSAESLQPFCGYVPTTAAAPTAQRPADGDDPHVAMLRDLRHLHVLAAGVALDWTALGQGAAAARDEELSTAAAAGWSDVQRTVKWTKTMLKTNAPQALTS